MLNPLNKLLIHIKSLQMLHLDNDFEFLIDVQL